MKARIALLLLVLLVPMARAQAPPAAVGRLSPAAPLPAALPYEEWNGVLVIKAALGAGLPQPAALATGLPLSLLAPDFARKAGILPESARDVMVMDRPARVAGAKPQMLRFGMVPLSDVPFGVFDLPAYLSSKKLANAPPLWLGTSALAAFSFTIDPRQKQVTFRPAGSPLPENAVVVPFEMRDGRPWVEVKVNGGKTFSAVLDTGAVGTMLPAGIARELNLPPKMVLLTTLPSGKPGKATAVALDELALGEAKMQGVVALYVSEGDDAATGDKLGILGLDVLLRYRVTVDYGARRLALEPLPPEPAAPPSGADPPKPEVPAGDGKKPPAGSP